MADDAGQLVVAFRTHVWSDDVARLARRLRYFAQGAIFVVLMDETNGPVPSENFAKISHTDDFSEFSLPACPAENSLWYNADYPLYLLRRHYPDATHYVMVEYDVAVNMDIMPMLRQAQDEKLDLIAGGINPANPKWVWHDTAIKHYPEPQMAFIPFLLVSARAVDILYRERLRIAALYDPVAGPPQAEWPYCETFVPTAIGLLENFACRRLREFIPMDGFKIRPLQHIDDPEMNKPGTLCHPVAGGAVFVKRRMKHLTYAEIMDRQGLLRRQLDFCKPEEFTEIFLHIAYHQNAPAKIQAFMDLAVEKRWPVRSLPHNIALFKPAMMSSVWAGAGLSDLAKLAGGGNNGVITGGFGFHTAFEDNAWWQVDLLHVFHIAHILLFNRMEFATRCRRLRAEGWRMEKPGRC